MINKKLCMGLSKFALFAIIAVFVSAPVYAADGDIYNASHANIGSVGSIILGGSSGIFDLITNINTYGYEVGGKVYNASQVNDLFNKNPNATLLELQASIKTNLVPTGDATANNVDFGVISID